MDVWDKSPLPPPEEGRRVEGDDPTAAAGAGSGSGSGGDEPPTDTGENPSGEGTPWWSSRIANMPAWLLVLLAIVIGVGIVALVVPGDSGDRPRLAEFAVTTTTSDVAVVPIVTSEPATGEPPVATIGKSPPITSTATTTTTTTTTPPTTTTDVPTTTTAPTTTAPTATASTVPASTVPSSAGISGPTTATGANGETLTVTPRLGECRYGPECFIASFTVAGFATEPTQFVCEFSSGARYVFRFSGTGADPACSTLDVPDSIVIEVGGLRADPVTISGGD